MARIMLIDTPPEFHDWLKDVHTIVVEKAELVLVGNVCQIDPVKNQCPVVFVVDRQNEADIERAYDLGVTECLLTPTNAVQVRRRIERIVSYSVAMRYCIENEKRYRAALMAIPDMIMHFKEDGTLIDAYFDMSFPVVFNPTAALGRKLTDVYNYALCTTFENTIKECIKLNKPIELTYEIKGKYREARVVPINHGMREALILVRDVTDIKEMSKELAELRSIPSKVDRILSLSEEAFQRATRATRSRKVEYA